MEETRLGFWECHQCKTENTGDSVVCNTCGEHLRYGKEQFYPISKLTGKEGRLLTDKEIERNPHWNCVACNAMNYDRDWDCHFCGGSRNTYKDIAVHNESDTVKHGVTYKDVEKRIDDENNVVKKTIKKNYSLANESFLKTIPALLIFILLGCISYFFYWLSTPSEKILVSIEAIGESTKYEIMDVKHEGFDMPYDGKLITKTERLQHYDKIYDHSEWHDVPVYKKRKVGEKCRDEVSKVSDGQEIVGYDTRNKGNGQFEKRPRYRTKYKTVTKKICSDIYENYTEYRKEEEKIYRQVPVIKPYYEYTRAEEVPTQTIRCTTKQRHPKPCTEGDGWRTEWEFIFTFDDGSKKNVDRFLYSDAVVGAKYSVSSFKIEKKK